MSIQVKIDLITERPNGGEFVLVLVEEGPWASDTNSELRRLQDRLYNSVDLAVDGHLAEKFPSSKGRGVVIRLDCYDTPEVEVKDFFEKFVHHVEESPKTQRDIQQKGFIGSLEFEYNRRTLQENA